MSSVDIPINFVVSVLFQIRSVAGDEMNLPINRCSYHRPSFLNSAAYSLQSPDTRSIAVSLATTRLKPP
jgi:hypothetical protein